MVGERGCVGLLLHPFLFQLHLDFNLICNWQLGNIISSIDVFLSFPNSVWNIFDLLVRILLLAHVVSSILVSRELIREVCRLWCDLNFLTRLHAIDKLLDRNIMEIIYLVKELCGWSLRSWSSLSLLLLSPLKWNSRDWSLPRDRLRILKPCNSSLKSIVVILLRVFLWVIVASETLIVLREFQLIFAQSIDL